MLDWLRQQAGVTTTPTNALVHVNGAWIGSDRYRRLLAATAQWLQGQGFARGDRVALLASNGLMHLLLQWSAPLVGLVYAPLNTRLPRDEQVAILDSIRPSLVILDAECAALIPGDWSTIACDAAHRQIEQALGADDFDAHLPDATGLPAEQVAMLLLTGGSTGVPKPAQIPLRQIAANARDTIERWGLGASDCAIQATPMFHAAVNVLTTPLLGCGGRVVVHQEFDAGRYLAAIAEHRATILFMVPTMYHMLAEHPDFAEADLSSVRFAVSGGAPCTADIRQAFAKKGIAFRQGYGLTEAGVNCFWTDKATAARAPESVGWPMPSLSAVIRQPSGAPCVGGETGELTLSGDAVFAGYLNHPVETARALRDGCLWTGDLATQDANGVFRIVGRRKEMFISGGENVFPPEVEAALQAIDGVAQCAVIGVPDPRWGEVGLAVVVPRAGVSVTAESMATGLSKSLARYKIPKHFKCIQDLPRTGAGKIDKPALRRAFAADNSKSDIQAAPVAATVLSEESRATSYSTTQAQ